MPAQANATVTKVAGSGTSDDWDRAAGAGADKWAGSIRAYYRESTDRIVDGDAVNVHVRRELIIDTASLDELELDTDDVVTFTPDGGPEDTGVAKAIRASRLASIPRPLQTAKITLDDR